MGEKLLRLWGCGCMINIAIMCPYTTSAWWNLLCEGKRLFTFIPIRKLVLNFATFEMSFQKNLSCLIIWLSFNQCGEDYGS